MSVQAVGSSESVAARRPVGLYAVIAYSVFIAVQLPLARLPTIPIGRFTLEGTAAQLAVVIWSIAWMVVIVGLFLLRRWGYRLGMTVFGLYIVLLGSNILRWLADNSAPVSIALRVAIWPMLPFLLTDLLVIAYLYARRGIFARRVDA
jgi:hypothetical protein